MSNRFKQTQLFGEVSPSSKPSTRSQFVVPQRPTPLWKLLFIYLPLSLFGLLTPVAVIAVIAIPFAVVMTFVSTVLTWNPVAWLGL